MSPLAIVAVCVVGVLLYAMIGTVVARAVAGHYAWSSGLTYEGQPTRKAWEDAEIKGAFAGLCWLAIPVVLLAVAPFVGACKLIRRTWLWADQRVAIGAERGRK